MAEAVPTEARDFPIVHRMHAFRMVRALLEERRTMVFNGSIETELERGERRAAVPRVVDEVRRADARLIALVQERPIATLCAAAAIGYLVGRVITRLS